MPRPKPWRSGKRRGTCGNPSQAEGARSPAVPPCGMGYVLRLARRRADIAEATLIRTNIGFRRRFQMAPRQRNQRVATGRPQRSDHGNVVAARAIERVRIGIGIRSYAVDFLRKLLDCLDETGIAADLVQCAVKMQIAVEDVEQVPAVDCHAVLALDFIELVDVGARHGKWQDSHRHDLQFFAYRVDLHDLLWGEVAHHRAAIWDALNNALFLELEKSQPNVGTVRVELLAKVLLDEPFTRMAPAQYDVLFEPRCDELGNGRSPRAAFCRYFTQAPFRRRGCAALCRLFSECPVHGHGETH